MNLTTVFVLTTSACLAFTSCQPTSKEQKLSDKSTEKVELETQKVENSAAAIMEMPEVPVLCYHRIADGSKGDYTVSTTTFEAHLKTLADSGYHSIVPAQLYDYLQYNKPLPEKPFMITFDDSRVEHATIAAPTLEKYGFRAAFFIMTITYNKKNYMTTEQIAALAKAGHAVGLHSWDHTMVTKYNDSTAWQTQVIAPKEKLEKIVGQAVEYFAYPNGVYNHTAAAKMSKHMKLSFALASKRDSLMPLQSVRRIIVPDYSANSLLNSMRKSFKQKSLLTD